MTNVILTGPVFDGRADALTDRMVTDIQHKVGDYAHDIWSTLMDHNFKHPTGVYQSFAHVVDDGPDTLVNDGYGVTNQLQYGPWLEGIGSRNSPVTRFPGYFSLREAFAATDRAVTDLAEPIVNDYVDRINHE
jgi:hypothetical protein